jgi:GntR family transcriptional regulator, carbon starvation induced regulator
MTAKKTKADIAAEMIKNDILSGNIAPKTQLKIQDVSKKYKIGLTPIREALNKLTQSGLVEERPLKGFFVTPLSADEIADIFEVRKLIEIKSFKLAMTNGDDAWEGSVISEAYQLKKMINNTESSIEQVALKAGVLWETMLSACNSASLIEIHKQLWLQCQRYREIGYRISKKNPSAAIAKRAQELMSTDLVKQVESLVESLLNRDEKSVIKIIESYYDTYSKMYVEFVEKHREEITKKKSN